MRRGLDRRLQRLERRIQPAASAVCIIGADRADCERQLQEMRAAGLTDDSPVLMYTGAPRRLLERRRRGPGGFISRKGLRQNSP
jgi:hypothetical protein